MRSRCLLALIVAVLGAAACGETKSGGSGGSSGGGESSSEKDARSYIKEHGDDAKRVEANVAAVQIAVGALQKSESEQALNEVAQQAQEAHDRLDEVRKDFASTNGSGELEAAELEVFSSANDLKNAMGALVEYTGNSNPATLAHFSSQYQKARDEWNSGIRTIWRLAHEHGAPTI